MSLYHALFDHDTEHILYETGVLLRSGDTDELENIWITVLSKIAEHLVVSEAHLFIDVLDHLDNVLQQPHIVIRDAFILSVKISYLLKRVSAHARERLSIHKLRDKIKTLFPEKAALSKEGVATFSKVLPPPERQAEHQFAQRIIAGLSKLWTEGGGQHYDNCRNCMEYLSRRKVEVNEDMDMTVFLWGVVHAYFKHDKRVATTYRLFSWNETKKTKKERLGLLWNIFVWVQPPASSGNVATLKWRDDEEKVFQKIHEKHKDLWQQLQESLDTKQKDEPLTGVDFITAFEPRGVPQEVYTEPYHDHRKNIELKKSKHVDGTASKHVKEKSSQVNKLQNEAYHLDPRYWRIHSSKEGA